MSEDIAMCEEEAAVALEKLTDVSRRDMRLGCVQGFVNYVTKLIQDFI